MSQDGLSRGLAAFQASIAEAEGLIRSTPGTSERDLAEGYRYLAGFCEMTLERVFSGFDPDRPRLVRCMDTLSKWGLENPDNVYRSAQVDPAGHYVVRGSLAGYPDLAIEVLTGLPGDNGVVGQRLAAIQRSELHADARGDFELHLGGPRQTRNWLDLAPDAAVVFTRQTVGDWTLDRCSPLEIDRLDTASAPSRPAAADIAGQYETAARQLIDRMRFMHAFAAEWRESLPLNAVTTPAQGGPGACPGQYHCAGRFEVGADEALVISFPAIAARYQGCVIGNALWFTSFDFRNAQCSLSGAQARLSDDGQYRFIVSARDLGFWNWLDSQDHERGFLFMRWQGVEGPAPPTPKLELVPQARLATVLPPGEPMADETARAEVLRLRRRAADLRFA